EILNKRRRDWNALPGRRIRLLNAAYEWLLHRPELEPVLQKVCESWRSQAAELPTDSEDRVILLRWACNFDRSMWKEVDLGNGQKAWQNQRPEALRNRSEEQKLSRQQSLLMLPHQCMDILEK